MKYLWTKTELQEIGQRLGDMSQGTYQEFMDKARSTGLPNPRLIIETELEQPSVFGLTEIVYPIAEYEWVDFSRDSLAKYTPVVYAVDGNEYTAGI